MNISLNPHFDEFIAKQVQSGRYNSVSEVVREGLRLLEVQEKHNKLNLEQLRREIQESADSFDRGEGVEGEVVFARIEKLLDQLEAQS
jgi:antitoxin ParD1/3/4